MRFISLLALPVFVVLGQDYGGYGAPAAPAASSTVSTAAAASTTRASSTNGSTGSPINHRVTVGLGGLVFAPNNITAAMGDTITFEYHPRNHTVAQSSFSTPCFHLANAQGAPTGSDSGYVPVSVNDTVFPTYSVVVQTTTPLWFFCNQGMHCQAGMVFAVNPPTSGNTMAAFIAQAANVTAIPASNNTIPSAVRAQGQGVAAVMLSTNGTSTAAGTSATASGAVGSATAAARSSASMVKISSTGLAVVAIALVIVL